MILILIIGLNLIFSLTAKERFELKPVKNAPKINGIISDQEWSNAVWLDKFYQTAPGDNETPTEKTEVAISYDEKNLYLLAKVYYADKTKERSFHNSRDKVYSSDRIFFFFDTFGSNNQGYYFGTNAFGEQADGLIRQDIDPSIDIYFKSVTSRTDFGWILEMEVPLKSLNYKSGDNVDWGFFIKRHINDGGEEVTSFPVDRNSGNFFDNYGILNFAKLPEKRNLKLNPSVIWINSQTNDDMTNKKKTDADIQPELNFFYEPNSHLTFTATLNPDFNIVEADGVNIDVNQRFPSWSQEKRPFFIEERNPYQTDLNIYNTRNIVNPKWGAKLSGSYDKNSFFILAAQDEDALGGRFDYDWQSIEEDAFFVFANYKRQLIKDDSFARIASTVRSFDDKENYVINADSYYRFNQLITHELQFAASFNEQDSTKTSGYAYHSDLDIGNDKFYIEYEQSGVSSDYKADLGFMHETDYHRTSNRLELHGNAEKESDYFHYWEIANTTTLKWDFAGEDLQELYWEPMLGMNTKDNWNLWVGFEKTMLRWFEQDNWNWYQWTSAEYFPIKEIGITHLNVWGEGLYLDSEHADPQDYRKYETTIYIRPISQLDIELRHKYHSLDEYYLVRTVEAIAKVQFHKNFWFRLITQIQNVDGYYENEYKDSVDIYPLFTFKPNSRISFYLGATSNDFEATEKTSDNRGFDYIYIENQESKTWFLKMSYTFDIL